MNTAVAYSVSGVFTPLASLTKIGSNPPALLLVKVESSIRRSTLRKVAMALPNYTPTDEQIAETKDDDEKDVIKRLYR